MKLVIQRVTEASVQIDGNIKSSIGSGLLILLGIENKDSIDDIQWLCNKLLSLRIFNDENQKMNLSIKEIEGEILLISQFTLHASTKKGNRPSFINAAPPTISIPFYEQFIQQLNILYPNKIKSGQFGGDMKVSLINDGPVTIIIDSKNRA